MGVRHPRVISVGGILVEPSPLLLEAIARSCVESDPRYSVKGCPGCDLFGLCGSHAPPVGPATSSEND